MKHFVLFALAALISCFSSAAGEWKTYFQNEQAKILYCYADCHDEVNGIHQEKIFLRMINHSKGKIEISFSKELTFANSKSSDGDGTIFKVPLNPSEVREGNCPDKDKALFLFSKHLNFSSTALVKFELKNISIKIVQ